ncbi:MAG: hypothetical protein JNL08_10635, partial [Planctomycetes bacterium]|nr:hypothetical protein [Planctomycetota bacterium]
MVRDRCLFHLRAHLSEPPRLLVHERAAFHDRRVEQENRERGVRLLRCLWGRSPPKALMIPIPRAALLLLLAAPLVAQHESVIRSSCSVVAVDGVVRAGGPNWGARFDERGVEFMPALAQRTEWPMPVRFTLESVRRGDVAAFVRTANVAPVVVGDQVRYAHLPDLAEVYEVRAEGVEQSFVFASKPAGTGDLVVRGAITTELPFVAASDDGVRFEREGLGGVTFGAVTGIDASGAAARGSIRVVGDGTHVEWVLPASFVEHAAYPLVLDPLIGSAIAIGDIAGGIDETPSVAFDESTGRYLVVWSAYLGGAGADLRGQFVTATGSPLGGGFLFGSGSLTRQAVANIAGTNRFLVAYTKNTPSIFGQTSHALVVRSVSAATGTLSNEVVVDADSSLATVSSLVVGGDSRSSSSAHTAMVMYRTAPLGIALPSMHCRPVDVPASGDPVLVGSFPQGIGAGTGGSITAHGGSSPRWLVTWLHVSGLGATPELTATVVDATGNPCGSSVTLATPAAGNSIGPRAAATPDGTTFLVAWSDSNGGAEDVHAMRLVWSGSCGSGTLTPGPLLAPITVPGLQDQPALAFAKTKFVLAWRNRANASATSRVYVKGLDPVTCESCGAEHSVENTVLGLETPAIASRYTAGDVASDETLVVWSNSTIRGRRFEANGTHAVASMGGGCVSGLSDFATYSGDAVLGNTDFQLSIAGSVSLPLVLIVGFSAVSAPCGNCTIVPSPDILFPAT